MTEQMLQANITPPQIGQSELERIIRNQDRRVRLQEASSGWQAIAFGANCGNFGGGIRLVNARKSNSGEVIARGLMLFSAIIPAGNVLGTLPAGMWPSAIEIFFLQYTNAGVRVDVNVNGTITMAANATANGGYLSLSGLRFYAD